MPVSRAGCKACLSVWHAVPVGVHILAINCAVDGGGPVRSRLRLATDQAVHVRAAKPCKGRASSSQHMSLICTSPSCLGLLPQYVC